MIDSCVSIQKGILGNERADRVAKIGTSKGKEISTGLGISEAKNIVKKITIEEWKEQWKNNTKRRHAYQLLSEPSVKNQVNDDIRIPGNPIRIQA